MHAHHAFAMTHRFHRAVRLHLQHALVIGKELRQPGHIALAAIGENGLHHELLRLPRLHRPHTAGNLQLRRIGLVRLRTGSATADPVHQRLPFARAFAEPRAAFMHHASARLFDQQTLLGKCVVHPTPVHVLRDPVVIPLRRKPAQRKLESILPRQLPVTPAGVAPRLRQQWKHVLSKRRDVTRKRGSA